MAIRISDPRSFKLEPFRKNGFIFQFAAIPGNSNQEDALAFVTESCDIPSCSFESKDFQRVYETFNVAGTPKWNQLNCTFYDFIRKSDANENSAGDILYDWSCMIYNPITGQMGYKTQYATSATLAQIDPAGNIVRAWNIFGIFPREVKYGDNLSYNSNDIQKVSATFVYDVAIKISDSKTSTESA